MRREGRALILRKSRWLLLRRSENLGADQHFRLRDLLRYNLKTVRAYFLKEALGRKVPRRVVPPDQAIPHRTHEEDSPFATQSS